MDSIGCGSGISDCRGRRSPTSFSSRSSQARSSLPIVDVPDRDRPLALPLRPGPRRGCRRVRGARCGSTPCSILTAPSPNSRGWCGSRERRCCRPSRSPWCPARSRASGPGAARCIFRPSCAARWRRKAERRWLDKDGSLDKAYRDMLVLKAPAAGEKGVLLLKYTAKFEVFVSLFDVERIMRDYYIVLEPCWAGYCDPSILCSWLLRIPSWCKRPTPPISRSSATCGENLVPIDVGASDWVDSDPGRRAAGRARLRSGHGGQLGPSQEPPQAVRRSSTCGAGQSRSCSWDSSRAGRTAKHVLDEAAAFDLKTFTSRSRRACPLATLPSTCAARRRSCCCPRRKAATRPSSRRCSATSRQSSTTGSSVVPATRSRGRPACSHHSSSSARPSSGCSTSTPASLPGVGARAHGQPQCDRPPQRTPQSARAFAGREMDCRHRRESQPAQPGLSRRCGRAVRTTGTRNSAPMYLRPTSRTGGASESCQPARPVRRAP